MQCLLDDCRINFLGVLRVEIDWIFNMKTMLHPLKALFEQLGLPADYDAITQFIAGHAPLDSSIVLAEASFWVSSQKNFLRDELLKDADWTETIDLLNAQLREPH